MRREGINSNSKGRTSKINDNDKERKIRDNYVFATQIREDIIIEQKCLSPHRNKNHVFFYN